MTVLVFCEWPVNSASINRHGLDWGRDFTQEVELAAVDPFTCGGAFSRARASEAKVAGVAIWVNLQMMTQYCDTISQAKSHPSVEASLWRISQRQLAVCGAPPSWPNGRVKWREWR